MKELDLVTMFHQAATPAEARKIAVKYLRTLTPESTFVNIHGQTVQWDFVECDSCAMGALHVDTLTSAALASKLGLDIDALHRIFYNLSRTTYESNEGVTPAMVADKLEQYIEAEYNEVD